MKLSPALTASLVTMLGVAVMSYFLFRSEPAWDKLPSRDPVVVNSHADKRPWASLVNAKDFEQPPECAGTGELTPFNQPMLLGCEQSSLSCQERDDNDLNAYCNPSCRLSLKPSTCSDLGLQAKQYSVQELRAAIKGSKPRAYDEIWAACAAAHQVRHLSDGLLRPHCVFEYRGHWEQILCLRFRQAELCDSNLPVLPAQECGQLAGGICYVEASRELQSCRCEKNITAHSACEQCLESCKPALAACYAASGEIRTPSQVAASCEQLTGLYCKNNSFP